jgi:hypothetical protein
MGKGHTKIIVANGVSPSLNHFNASSNDTKYSYPTKNMNTKWFIHFKICSLHL